MYNLRKLVRTLKEERNTRKVIKVRDVKTIESLKRCMIVRCDIERNPTHALSFADILKNERIFASFYFHTRTNCYDAGIMNEIQNMGHEVGFHHECLDRCRGDFKAARELFLREVDLFRRDGVSLKTVCSHGEAGIRREGYKCNYDLFQKYPMLLDEAGLLGEAYFLRRPFKYTAASDVFRGYFKIYETIHRAEPEIGLHVLLHPHRWDENFLKSSWQIFLDLKQIGKNKLFKERSYQTVVA